MHDETFDQHCARLRENGNSDPCKRPEYQRGSSDAHAALFHHAQSLGAWGDLGWQRVAEMEADLDSTTAALSLVTEQHQRDQARVAALVDALQEYANPKNWDANRKFWLRPTDPLYVAQIAING